MSHNVSAYTYFNNFNITKFSYKLNTQSATEQSVNSINYNGSTPLMTDSFTENYHAILNPKFTLNKDANLSKTQRLHLKLELLTRTRREDGSSSFETYFVCPQGLDQLRISRCDVYALDNEGIQGAIWVPLDPPASDSMSEPVYTLMTDKNYLVELEIYYNSNTPVAVRDIALAGRILMVSVTPEYQFTTATNFRWQIAYQLASAFYYEDPNAAADAIKEQNQKEDEAVSSIEDQSPSDIEGSTSTQTTSIIGVLGNFVSALGNVQATSCNLTLAFPSFMGGSQTVNPCLGKDKAPTIVQAASSMLLIVFFLPLSIILLKMIYNEIRSWTSG